MKKPITIGRKKTPPVATPPFVGPDPTAETARYLRDRAQELGDCAPRAGGEIRVHLEVTVTPDGQIEAVRIANLEPLPLELASCVEERVSALEPPGFDGSENETFALTVVL